MNPPNPEAARLPESGAAVARAEPHGRLGNHQRVSADGGTPGGRGARDVHRHRGRGRVGGGSRGPVRRVGARRPHSR